MSGNITSTSADSVPRVTGGTDSVPEGVMEVPTGRTSADIDIQDSSTTRTASVRNATGAHLRPRRLGRLLEHRRGAADTYATGSVIGSSTRTDRRMAAVRRGSTGGRSGVFACGPHEPGDALNVVGLREG